MAGVDKGDQYQQYYRIRTKSRKNYLSIIGGSALMDKIEQHEHIPKLIAKIRTE